MKIGASYSTLCEGELLSELVPQYQVKNLETCRFWQRGINDTYQVHCANDKYSLRIYRHKLRSKGEIEFEISALNYLNANGASVAYPIKRRDGGYISELDSPEGLRYAILTKHAKGTEPNYDDSENGILFGAAVADLHHISEGFETKHIRPRLEIEYLLDNSLDIVKSYCHQNPKYLTYLNDTAMDLRHSVAAVPSHRLDIGFCHGDCHGCNVHNHNGTLTHFDFDCCGFGYRVFELATFKWGISGDDNERELWAAFLKGYSSKREISADDLALVDTFVVIRQIWWMALIMGNARDFGYSATSSEFVDHHIGKINRLLNNI